MTNILRELCKDPQSGKEWSASRTPLIFLFLLLILAWAGTGVSIFFFGGSWEMVSGWLGWGKDMFLLTAGVFVGGKAVGKINGKQS